MLVAISKVEVDHVPKEQTDIAGRTETTMFVFFPNSIEPGTCLRSLALDR